MNHAYTVSGPFAQEVVNAFKRMGYQTTGLSAHFQQDENRIPLHEFCHLLAYMEAESQNPDIGLLLGKLMEPSCFTIVGHLVMACNTVGEALAFVAKLQPLVIDCADSTCKVTNNSVSFYWTPDIKIPYADKTLVDLILSATRNFGIWATGITEPFEKVFFQHSAPKNTATYHEIFGHSGFFNASDNGFTIPASWYDRPIRSANNELKPIIYKHAEQMLQTVQSSEDIVTKLKLTLQKLLPEGHATIESAAAALCLSPRTLQRQLNEQSTQFSEVLQQVRLEQANHLLKNTRMSLTEIAMQVGYREQSSFSNAYKNWVGISPKEIRLKALG